MDQTHYKLGAMEDYFYFFPDLPEHEKVYEVIGNIDTNFI